MPQYRIRFHDGDGETFVEAENDQAALDLYESGDYVPIQAVPRYLDTIEEVDEKGETIREVDLDQD